MIVRGFRRQKEAAPAEAKGFDAYELRLGDVMRGERATQGKSLLDVQRELKIKAAYIAAIENADPTAFDTPGFIAGYVRSYARYLGMDPDWAFDTFCTESGFATAHGMSSEASSVKPSREERLAARPAEKDMFSAPSTPFIPAGEAMFARVEPGAVGSILVLIAVVLGLGYGGWTILQEVQKVQLAPVEQAPVVVAEIDPLAGNAEIEAGIQTSGFIAPTAESLDRLYRPEALDVPVLVARDGPIATLDPSTSGVLAPFDTAELTTPSFGATTDYAPGGNTDTPAVQVIGAPTAEVVLVAVRPAWVRIRAADGTVIFEKILDTGEEYILPATEEPPVLRAGNSGSLYFMVNGVAYGPAGPGTQTAKNVALSATLLQDAYAVADLNADPAAAQMFNVAEVAPEQ